VHSADCTRRHPTILEMAAEMRLDKMGEDYIEDDDEEDTPTTPTAAPPAAAAPVLATKEEEDPKMLILE
jgi:hypothetical protein